MHRIRLAPLALLVLAALHWPAGDAQAATRVVTNCNDAGPGSLRAAAAAANSGDVIDLRGLSCTRILLTTGAIRLPDQFITIIGAGESRITIDGNHASRVFDHEPLTSAPWPLNNNATLRLRRLTVANGTVIQNTTAIGGCILARRHIRLEYAQVHHCLARGTASDFPTAVGGGIFAGGNAILFHAAVFANRAEGGEDDTVAGGVRADLLHVDHSVIYGNYSDGNAGGGMGAELFVTYSTIRDNVAGVNVGGIDGVNGPVVINKSTLSGNRARLYGAGGSFSSGYPVTISNSTISGNHSQQSPGALGLDGRTSRVRVINSTIVNNVADAPFDSFAAGGVEVFGPVEFQSSIIANNFVGSVPHDIWAQVDFGAAVLGADNLIEASNAPVPVDTIMADPMLGPLASNGGRTRTHALLSGSPAIDAGNNSGGFAWDQRGPGFPRVVGPRTDIGAFEWSP